MNSPLPPASESGRSWIASPVVLITLERQLDLIEAERRREPVLRLVRLGERERAAARADG